MNGAGLLDSLTYEADEVVRKQGAGPSQEEDDEEQYSPPPEESLSGAGLIGSVSLEMDDESDEELEALASALSPDKDRESAYRFVLLRELWATAR